MNGWMDNDTNKGNSVVCIYVTTAVSVRATGPEFCPWLLSKLIIIKTYSR